MVLPNEVPWIWMIKTAQIRVAAVGNVPSCEIAHSLHFSMCSGGFVSHIVWARHGRRRQEESKVPNTHMASLFYEQRASTLSRFGMFKDSQATRARRSMASSTQNHKIPR